MPAKSKNSKKNDKKDLDVSIKVNDVEKLIKKGEKMNKGKSCGWNCGSGCGGGAYFLGFIGAVVYYISTAPSFWWGVWGVIKALVWPAFLVFELLKFIGA